MRNSLFALVFAASPALAQAPDVGAIVDAHILPGYQALAESTAALATTAEQHCATDDPKLQEAYGAGFDAWIAVSHLRFGPSEQGDRAFALAFWPDSRGATPKALGQLIRDEDPVVQSLDSFQNVSIAARGFYAMEFLLYDDQFSAAGSEAYRCALVQVMSADIAATSAAILADWETGYADLMRQPGNDTYRTAEEAAKQLFTALATGLEFTGDTRIGRPMGSYDRPRPMRAETRRSGRSLRHVVLSLAALRDLGARLSGGDTVLDTAFARALTRADNLDDPVFAGVSDPQGRIRIEALQQRISEIREIVAQDLGPRLGIAAGFNSMDGD
ncbi:imelysin family protein [Mameliella sp. AT18]|uniref:imelysin family protein n=1 Tax=Mameliella sp. AT18 TaxID=3028385 RepID=UPI0008410725|nr:imelysin family protein [Mameliella sp. AT18]MDD9733729.1 imelysin family protein [Mameliella sp. AT18]ODM49706.1 peptidase M75 [Ruegeria sp. PBVC088]